MHPLHRVVFAPDEQRHTACDDVVWTPAHRSIDHVDPEGGYRLGGAWAARGVYDEHGTRRHGGDQAVLEADLAHLIVGEHTDDDGIGALGDGRRIRYRGGAQMMVCCGLFGCAAQRADLMAGVGQTPDHRSAHSASADESDPRHRGCCSAISAASAASKTAPWGADA